MQEFRSYLQSEFNRRKESNPAYSIRAFARYLNLDQSTLSKVFKGERHFNSETMAKCLERLKTPESILSEIKKTYETLQGDFEPLEEVMLDMMASWKYWAILEFLKIHSSPDESRIAEHFHIDVSETETILDHLKRLGFIDEKLKLLKPNNKWTDNYRTSEARRELQKGLLKLSLNAIDKYSVQDRYHGSLTVAIPKKRLPLIKTRISEFQEELGQYAQKDCPLDEVYQLTISFFPLS